MLNMVELGADMTMRNVELRDPFPLLPKKMHSLCDAEMKGEAVPLLS